MLFHDALSFQTDSLIEHDLILKFGNGGAFNGRRVGNEGIQIEFVIIYLPCLFPILCTEIQVFRVRSAYIFTLNAKIRFSPHQTAVFSLLFTLFSLLFIEVTMKVAFNP